MSKSDFVSNPQGRFGTFEGVFAPCVLTILGVIMFMRTGFVLGHGGLWLGIAILGISKLITVLTTLSLSAISTNTEVRGGGVYFMISRSLGPDFGGTIGLTLFIAQAVGVSFYVIGFTEALLGSTAPFLGFLASENQTAFQALEELKAPQFISSLVVGALFFLAFRGADLVMKVQNYILGILVLSIASFLVGGFLKFDAEIFEMSKAPQFTDGISFWTAFAIFFPAATGITAGANMSGDLRKPERSIPWGTLMAIFFTLIIYVGQLVILSGSVTRDELKALPFESLKALSFFSPLVIFGVFAATLSSALGSFLGAPRILQAMGRDGLMKSLAYFAKGEGPSEEPKRATLLTFIIAFAVIWAGDLNAVAEVISMFFLIAYGTINLSAFVESRGGNPSFRPKFKFFHWGTALAGAIGCGIAMVKINDSYALLALLISSVIYFYLKKQDISTSFGDAKRGYIFKGVRDSLTLLEGTKAHPKNWRPILLTLTEDLEKDEDLLKAGAWLESGRGILTILHLNENKTNSFKESVADQEKNLDRLKETLAARKIRGFTESLITKDFHEGLFHFLQSHSMGAIKTNSVLLKIPMDQPIKENSKFLENIRMVACFNKNLLLLKPGKWEEDKKRRTIDIWWRNEINGSLMALFSYLMSLHADWNRTRIRLIRDICENENRKEIHDQMSALIRQARMDAELKLVPSSEDPLDLIKTVSGYEADFVFLGMGATNADEAQKSIENIEPLLQHLPTTLLVWSNGEANLFV